MKVRELMSTDLCTCDPESTVGEAATLMGEHRVGSVLVCEGERLAGILTERDIVRALTTAHDAPQRPVIEWMTKDPTTASPETELRDALRTMVDGGFRHLPITENDRVIGMVSMRDAAETMT